MAKSLRREKRRDEAAAVAALRRPGWDDWALNVAAAEHGAEVAAFVVAALAVREAQSAAIEGRDGPDVRSVLRDLRERTAELVRVATAVLERADRQAGSGELNGRLSEVAGSESALAELRAGVLGAGGNTPSDPFAGLEPAAPQPSRPARAPAPATPPTPPATPPAPATPADGRGEREERRRRTAALREATQAHRAATKALARADAQLETSAAAAGRAERALADARRLVADAQRDRDAAADAVAATDAELERARAAVEDGTDSGA